MIHSERQNNAGITLIEILIVTTLVILFTIVLISNFPQTKSRFALARTAYKFEQDIRRAQALTLSSTPYKDAQGNLQTIKGYGLYVDLASNKKYIIYADNTAGNQMYDAGVDYVVETDDFSSTESGVIVSQISNNANVNAQNVSINFSPPNPTTKITFPGGQNTDNVNVVFSLASDPTQTKTVSINTTGLVELK